MRMVDGSIEKSPTDSLRSHVGMALEVLDRGPVGGETGSVEPHGDPSDELDVDAGHDEYHVSSVNVCAEVGHRRCNGVTIDRREGKADSATAVRNVLPALAHLVCECALGIDLIMHFDADRVAHASQRSGLPWFSKMQIVACTTYTRALP